MLFENIFGKKTHPLTAKTNEFLEQLNSANWYLNAGQAMDNIDTTVFAASWSEALTYYRSESFDSASLESLNEISLFLHQKHRAEYEYWNEKIRAIKAKVIPLSERKIKEAVKLGHAPSTILKVPVWSELMGCCIALEYAEFFHSEYYEKVRYFYLSGHFVCGWKGDVPENFENAFSVGTLVAY